MIFQGVFLHWNPTQFYFGQRIDFARMPQSKLHWTNIELNQGRNKDAVLNIPEAHIPNPGTTHEEKTQECQHQEVVSPYHPLRHFSSGYRKQIRYHKNSKIIKMQKWKNKRLCVVWTYTTGKCLFLFFARLFGWRRLESNSFPRVLCMVYQDLMATVCLGCVCLFKPLANLSNWWVMGEPFF